MREKRSILFDSGKNYPFSALLSGKKGRFLTKSQGKYFWGTAGNPDLDYVILAPRHPGYLINKEE